MHIANYLEQQNLSQAGFGEIIGVSQAAVERYVNGKRIPEPEIMTRIAESTKGAVTANDFYGITSPLKRKRKSAQ